MVGIIVGTILFFELLTRLGLFSVFQKILAVADKARKTIRSQRISDHWKQKVLLAYAKQLAGKTLLLFAIMGLSVVPLLLLTAAFQYWGLTCLSDLLSPAGLILGVLSGLFYALSRHWIFKHGNE